MNGTEIIPEVTAKSSSKTGRLVKLFLKIIVTLACLWYVRTKIDFEELLKTFDSAGKWLFAAAVLTYCLSKIAASRRLLLYFKAIHIPVSDIQNLKLFWLGMFYNLFLPGSITGDAYKVFLLKKKFNASYKKTSAAVVLDRFSGLLALSILLCIYGFFVLQNNRFIIVLATASLSSVGFLYLIVKKFFPDFSKPFGSTFFWGLIVQLLMVACIELLLRSLHISNTASYVFIFLIATIASVLPLTIGGGLGIREFVFLEGAGYFGLDPHLAVAVSLLYYLVTVLASLPGMFFIFKEPIKGKVE